MMKTAHPMTGRSNESSRQGRWTRRGFMQAGGGVAAALAALDATAPRSRASGRRRRGRPTPPRSRGQNAALLMLVNRATFGYSLSTYDDAQAMGYDDWLEAQLNPESIDDSQLDAMLGADAFPTLNMTSQQIWDTYTNMAGVPVRDLIQSRVLRAILSKRQLLERMVEFWTDHFNIDIRDGQCQYLKTADDRDVIRTHALGTFPELLRASARSAAMSFYLDGYNNFVGHAQENYGREVMELHTMSVDGGYTQNDVEEVARCFTGWDFFKPNSGQYGAFWFRPNRHDSGAKTVLGIDIPKGGDESDGETVLEILANHSSTARFIARKLTQWFLGYDPPEDIVESVRTTYQATGGDIKEMLRVIFRPEVLTNLATPKFKRPLHFIVSLVRAANAQLTPQAPRFLTAQLETLGQLPFHWPRPDGYPDSLETWGTSVHPRWTFASTVLDGTFQIAIDVVALLNTVKPKTLTGQEAAAINTILTGGTMSVEELSLIQDFYDASAKSVADLRDAFGLAASAPSFQHY